MDDLRSKASEAKHALGSIAKKGFFHIFGATTINKILVALLGIVLVRILSKEEYGMWGFANNIISFFVILNGLGAPSAIMQLCSEHYKDVPLAKAFYSFGAKTAVAFDLLLALVIVFIGLLVPLSVDGSNRLLLLYCLYPLVVLLCELRLTWLRTRRENRLYAIVTNVQTVLLVLLSILGAFLLSAIGLIIGQYIAYLVTFSIVFLAGEKLPLRSQDRLSKSQKADYWSIAPISAINIGLSQALALFGTFLVGVMMTDAADVANYKVATTIPFALMFLPGTVMTFVYPYFAEKRNDGQWTRLRFRQLILLSIMAFALLTAIFMIFANPIVSLVFGSDYLNSVPPYLILMIGFFVNAAFRNPCGNLLVTQRKLEWNLLTNIISAITSVALSIVLIPRCGMMGAAWAYSISVCIAAVLCMGKYVTTISKLR